MAARLKLRRILFAVAATIAVMLPVFFQNCSEPLDASRDVLSVSNNLEMSFDANIDHLAYMSCSFVPANANKNNFFTFKAGAYNDGNGVKLTEDFFYTTRNLLNSDKVSALRQSSRNSGVFSSLAIRDVGALQSVLTSAGESSLGMFVGSLTETTIATKLVNESQVKRLNKIPAPFETTVHFKATEATAAAVRADLQQNKSLVALGFGQIGQQVGYGLSPVANSATKIYGLGYRMGFVLGTGQQSAFTSGAARVMTNVREYSLMDGSQTSSVWDCSANWRFMIVRPEDLGVRAICENINTEPTPTNQTQAEMLAVLRKVLPAAAWGVNLQRRCIVQKTGTDACYGGTTQPTINYTGGTCDPTQGTCPHFLTICKKR